MSKTVKIAVSVGVCIICLLSVLFGCLFGIKCHITFDYGFAVNTTTPTSQDYDSARELIIKFSKPYLKEVDVTRFTKYAPDRPYRSGYTFEGWYTDSACTISWNNTAVKSDMTLYAKWKAN